MKAIETNYKGYRFRSRLEARWAVFFDALGIEWEYEPQGFDLGGGVRYLPDFFINRKYYAEVKPRVGEIGQFDKAMLMARHGQTVLGLGGVPDTIAYPVFGPVGQGQFETYDVAINSDSKYGPFFWCCGVGLWENWRGDCGLDDGNVLRAIALARSVRFEHGESGVR